MRSNEAVIVKKVKKYGGGEHHGGMWKVAYADFVTAMMAFFLLLWLLSMVSYEKRARLSAYFKYFSLYTSGGTSWMEKSSEIFGESGENKQKVFTGLKGKTVSNADNSDPPLTSIEKELEKDIAEKLGDMKDHVLVDIVDEGIRIQMTDTDGSLMFELGSTTLTSRAKEVLKVIGENINQYTDDVIIEGHTDSLPYAGSEYSNWELSTERASSARRELEEMGLDPKRIARVAGYADTDPLIKDNPQDPRNRRISIIVNIPGKDKAGSITINSDEHQLHEISKELLFTIDEEQIPVNKEKHKDTIFPIENGTWIPAYPEDTWFPLISEDDMSPTLNNYDYDSIIKEGESILTNKKNSLTKKDSVPFHKKERTDKSAAVHDGENPATHESTKVPAIIKDFSNPVMSDEEWSPVLNKDEWALPKKKR